jgi:hypothetical protein
VNIGRTGDTPEVTAFGSDGWREYLPGLFSWTADQRGYYDDAASQVDEYFDETMAGSSVLTFIYGGSASGMTGYSGDSYEVTYTTEAATEGAVGVAVTYAGSGQLWRSVLMMDKLALTATASGASLDFDSTSAVSAGGYAALHVFGGSGGTIDVDVQTASVAAPTTWTQWMTFGQQVGPAACTLLDTATTPCYVRVVAAIGGATPTYDFVVAVGGYNP